jgi:hypothetical protein
MGARLILSAGRCGRAELESFRPLVSGIWTGRSDYYSSGAVGFGPIMGVVSTAIAGVFVKGG